MSDEFPVAVMEAAKAHLLIVLHEHKEMTPSELDEATGLDTLDIALGALSGQGVPKNVFTVGMKELMDAGKVEAWHDGAGWHYKLSAKVPIITDEQWTRAFKRSAWADSLLSPSPLFRRLMEEGRLQVEAVEPGNDLVAAFWNEHLADKSPLELVEDLIKRAREEERETCAQIADSYKVEQFDKNGNLETAFDASPVACAIRARSEDNPPFCDLGEACLNGFCLARRHEAHKQETPRAPTGFGQDTLTALQTIRRALRSVESSNNKQFSPTFEEAMRHMPDPGVVAQVREAQQALDWLIQEVNFVSKPDGRTE